MTQVTAIDCAVFGKRQAKQQMKEIMSRIPGGPHAGGPGELVGVREGREEDLSLVREEVDGGLGVRGAREVDAGPFLPKTSTPPPPGGPGLGGLKPLAIRAAGGARCVGWHPLPPPFQSI